MEARQYDFDMTILPYKERLQIHSLGKLERSTDIMAGICVTSEYAVDTYLGAMARIAIKRAIFSHYTDCIDLGMKREADGQLDLLRWAQKTTILDKKFVEAKGLYLDQRDTCDEAAVIEYDPFY